MTRHIVYIAFVNLVLLALMPYVLSESPPLSVLYPSATPTFNYADTVVFVWVTVWDKTEVDLYFNQGQTYETLYTRTGNQGDINTGIYTYPEIGGLFITNSWITSWPATCVVTLKSVGDDSLTQTGGNFVISSNAEQAKVEWGLSFTSTFSTSPSALTPQSSITSLQSNSSISSPTVTSIPTTLPTLANSPLPSALPEVPSLSVGAKAGVTVGCVLGGLLSIAGIAWYLLIRRRKTKMDRQPAGNVFMDKPELHGTSVEGAQLGDNFVKHEASELEAPRPQLPQRGELDAAAHPSELPTSSGQW